MDQCETGRCPMNVTLHIDGKPVPLENVTRSQGELSFTFGGKAYSFSGARLAGGVLVLEQLSQNDVTQRHVASLWQSGKQTRVQVGGTEAAIAEQKAGAAAADGPAPLSPPAPMPGLVRQVLVKAGDKVKKGQTLVVMEAMKLHTTLTAGDAATVDKVLVKEGELVAEGAELVRLKPL